MQSFRDLLVQKQLKDKSSYQLLNIPDLELTDDPFVIKYKTINDDYKFIDLKKHHLEMCSHERQNIILADIVSQLGREIHNGTILPKDLDRWYQVNKTPYMITDNNLE